MIEAYKFRFPAQIVFFLLCLLSCAAIGVTVDFYPALRVRWDLLPRGVLGGVVTALVVGVVTTVGVAFLPLQKGISSPADNFHILTGALVSAFAEEVLRTGYLFAPLLLFSPALAFVAVAAITAALYFDGRSSILYVCARILEGMFLAAMYWWNRSLYLVVIARLVSELLLFSPVIKRYLEPLGQKVKFLRLSRRVAHHN